MKVVFFFFTDWEATSPFGNSREGSSEETLLTWGGRGQVPTEEEVHQGQRRGLAFSPGDAGGLHTSTKQCCQSISWFNDFPEQSLPEVVGERKGRKKGRMGKRERGR